MDSFNVQDPESGRRHQSPAEELANSLSHGFGLVAAGIAAPWLLRHAHERGRSSVVATAIFLAAVMFTYLASTLYHAVPRGRLKHFLRVVEHMAIFILIAGTYTPFTLSVLRGPWGWTLFGLVWFLAVAGIVLKGIVGVRLPWVAGTLYVGMGWLVLIAAKPLWARMDHRGFLWILLGGLAYTGGVVFYAIDSRMRFSHFIWHLFVLAGTALHIIAIHWYT